MAMDTQAGLDNTALENVANELGEDWVKLSTYLSFNDEERQAIRAAFPNQVNEQANYMLMAWKDGYKGADMLGDLKGALRVTGHHGLLQELGEEILDDKTLKTVAHSVGDSWPELALYLEFDVEQCKLIEAAFQTVKERAGQMLAAWREKFTGNNPVEYLIRALISMERDDIAKKIVLSPCLPSCSCGNMKVLKFQPYFSTEDEPDGTRTQLIGIRCTNVDCGQEWLLDRFLYHPDVDRTRPKIKLRGVDLKKQLKIPRERNLAFQVKESRTKISNPYYAGDYLKEGDHITWHRPWGLWHHAVVSRIDKVGRVKIIHWTKSGCEFPRIMEKWTDLKHEYGELFRIDYPEEINRVNPTELVIARARSRVGDTGYGLFSDNCEAFVSYCKTGVAESNQVMWFYDKCKQCIRNTLVSFGKNAAKAGFIVGKEYAKEGTKNLLLDSGEVAFAELFERIGQGSDALGAFFIFFFEGVFCVWDLSKFYENRNKGNMSREDFLGTGCRRVSEGLIAAGLAVGAGIGGGAAGGALGTFLFPGFGTAIGTFLGSILGGATGSFIGRPIGSIVGSNISRVLTSAIGTDDKAVKAITDLEPADHVVFYGNLLHPRHHAIVVNCQPDKKKVLVVHNTYSKGVVEELVDFIHPVYRLVYETNACYLPDEVLERARSKIGDDTYKYSLAFNNCKSFARWCKQK